MVYASGVPQLMYLHHWLLNHLFHHHHDLHWLLMMLLPLRLRQLLPLPLPSLAPSRHVPSAMHPSKALQQTLPLRLQRASLGAVRSQWAQASLWRWEHWP